jgi:hypothetical protein
MRYLLLLIAALALACDPHAETPEGEIDGTNRVFTLAYEPAANSPYFKVKINEREVPVASYNATGRTIEFHNGKQPKPGDSLIVYYRSGEQCI